MCFHLFAGNVYLWSNIATYIISYFHYLGDKNATLSIGVICMPLTWFFQAAANPLGAYLQKRYNVKIILGTASLLMILSVYAASQAKQWWTFVFFMDICFPFAMGIGFW